MKIDNDSPIQDYSNKEGAFSKLFNSFKPKEYDGESDLDKRESRSSRSFKTSTKNKYDGIKVVDIDHNYNKRKNIDPLDTFTELDPVVYVRKAFIIYIVVMIIAGIWVCIKDIKDAVHEFELGDANNHYSYYTLNEELYYASKFYDTATKIELLSEIEFSDGTTIPTLYKYIKLKEVDKVKKEISNNIVAENSPTVQITYPQGSSIYIEIFGDRLVNTENYKKIINQKYEKDIYIRREDDKKFSYIIIDGTKIVYGLSYGTPKIKSY